MLLSNVDFTKIHPNRSGVIPYVRIKDHVYFLMGVDTNTGELSDFGGGVKAYENALSGGLRECMEEIRWILSFGDFDVIKHGFMSEKSKQQICIMFAKVKDETFFKNAKNRFHDKSESRHFHEMADVVWIRDDEMLKICRLTHRNSNMWQRIRHVLSKCGSFNSDFLKML